MGASRLITCSDPVDFLLVTSWEIHIMREYGRIQHNGQSFVNLGAVVERRHVAGYAKGSRLTTWDGRRTLLDCRFQVFDEWRDYWGDPIYVVGWKLTNGRAIVGLSLGDGMLFRGELVDDCLDDDDVRRAALAEAEHWADLDREDTERDQAEQLELVEV
jgi:hypothetical protein